MPISGSANAGRGLSVRQLTFIFFGAIAVCAVFFALGFMVGANQTPSHSAPHVEQVSPRGEIPPEVNPPAQESQAPASAVPTPAANSSSVVEQDLKRGGPPAVAAPPVSQELPKTADQPPKEAATPDSESVTAVHGLMVQVAASRTEAHARSLAHTLRAHRFRAMVIPAQGGRLYRVQVGPFTSHQKALAAVHKLSREGFRPFIKKE